MGLRRYNVLHSCAGGREDAERGDETSSSLHHVWSLLKSTALIAYNRSHLRILGPESGSSHFVSGCGRVGRVLAHAICLVM